MSDTLFFFFFLMSRRPPTFTHTDSLFPYPALFRSHLQCGSGNRCGFTLHGLLPDGKTKEWPQYCRPASLLPERVLSQHLCATPDLQLIQHEWADRKSTRLNSSH